MTAPAVPETDVQRLARLKATLDFWEARTGGIARQNQSFYRREVRHLEKKLAAGR